MDKNLFLAVALSVAVYAAWFGFFEKRLAPPARPPAAGQTAPTPQTAPTKTTTRVEEAAAPGFAGSAGIPAQSDTAEPARLGDASLLIRSRGAAISSWKFPGPKGLIELVNDPNPGLLATFPDLAFKPAGGSGLSFEAALGALRVNKEFILATGTGKAQTLPRLRLTLSNGSNKPVESGPWTLSVGPGLGTIPSEQKDNASVTRTLGLLKAEGSLNGKLEIFKQPGDRPADYRWIGVDNRYFLAALLGNPAEFEKATALGNHALVLTAKSVVIAPNGSHVWEVPFYIGAKGHTWLSRYKLGLERSIDFGFFAQLGRGVLMVLDKIYHATGNWGWSIILLTVIIQLAMFPLTFQSLKAAAAMKSLQPEIARLQQRYSKDPKKLNAEMMELYKKHGANPLGGCLPMLVQMPVFIALYNALRNAWELHGQGWIWWIHDLSAKDPFYVLPLLMGGLMFAQNKLSPAMGGDKTQQQMMTFMPVIFTVMFLNFPSGLVLYWMTNSLVSTLSQLVLRDRLGQSPRT